MKRKNKLLALCISAVLTGSMTGVQVSAIAGIKDSNLVSLLDLYDEVALNEAVLIVKYEDNHSDKYYWSADMLLPIKVEDLDSTIDISDTAHTIVTTPDNVQKIIINQKNYYTRIYYNYTSNQWMCDENNISKSFSDYVPDSFSKYLKEAIFIAENNDGTLDKYYWSMEFEHPINVNLLDENIDISKVENIFTVTPKKSDYNNRIPIETKYYYTYMGYNFDSHSWKTEESGVQKTPPIDNISKEAVTGDVNNDGCASTADLMCLKEAFLSEGSNNITHNYDINSDGIVSALDIARLVDILLESE